MSHGRRREALQGWEALTLAAAAVRQAGQARPARDAARDETNLAGRARPPAETAVPSRECAVLGAWVVMMMMADGGWLTMMHGMGLDSASIAAAVQRCEPWKTSLGRANSERANERSWAHHRHRTPPPTPPTHTTTTAIKTQNPARLTNETSLLPDPTDTSPGKMLLLHWHCTAAVPTDLACMKKSEQGAGL